MVDAGHAPNAAASRPFYTRGPELAELRALVAGRADLSYSQADIGDLFRAVDAWCARRFPSLDRGSCFSPLFLGGTVVNHTPPHLIFAVYALYSDLHGGSPEPVPFRSCPLAWPGATALRIRPEEGLRVKAVDGSTAALTDLLISLPSGLDNAASRDIYGIPALAEGIVPVGCHGAAASRPEAMFSAELFLHPPSGAVLDPWSVLFTEAEEQLFFTGPVQYSRMASYRDLNAATLGVPMAMVAHNHITARHALEACLAGAS